MAITFYFGRDTWAEETLAVLDAGDEAVRALETGPLSEAQRVALLAYVRWLEKRCDEQTERANELALSIR